MNKLFVFLLFVIVAMVSCTTDPILVEVIGDTTTPSTPASDVPLEPVLIEETNACGNGRISFQHEVLPLLVSNCAYSGCHDAKTHKEGIVTEDYQSIKKEVRAGNLNKSQLYEVIIKDPNDKDIMPEKPATPLNAAQINIVKLWIEQGAEDTDCRRACNSIESSFAVDIFPIIYNKCYGCHQPNNRQGSISLEDYSHIKAFALNGALLGSIKFQPAYPAMPPTGNQLTECEIGKIQNWIIEGALDN